MTGAVCLLGGDYESLNPNDPLVAAVGDPERRSVLIFGGFAVLGPRRYGPPSGDLWEWDRTRGRIVLRGGTRPDKVHPTDTWEWDGAAWTDVSASTSL